MYSKNNIDGIKEPAFPFRKFNTNREKLIVWK